MENNFHTTELLEQRNIFKNEFVPYEQALELQNLGFEEYTFSIFGSDGNIVLPEEDYPIMKEEYCKAPTFSQAFKWLRDKGIFCCISPSTEMGKYHVEYASSTSNRWELIRNYNSILIKYTYEEAELACLKKLIEIAKTKTN